MSNLELVKEKVVKAKVGKEKMYDCEVERIRIQDGKRSRFWKVKTVLEAIVDEDTRFRCRHCHGDVKLLRRNPPHAAESHVEHKSRYDAEYCPSGLQFQQATDGRTPRMSSAPVE